MTEEQILYYFGELEVLDGSLPDRRTEPFSSGHEAKAGILSIINEDDGLQVAAVGNPTGIEDIWTANLRYRVVGEYTNGSKNLESGYVIPSESHKNGIWLRPAFSDLR